MTEPSLGGKRVLVTGASGYVGRQLTQRLLQHGARVRTLVRSPHRAPQGAETIVGDARDLAVVRRACDGVESVFHVAGKAHDFGEARFNHEQYDISVGSAIALTSALTARPPISLVFLSSLSVYGEHNLQERDEESQCEPTTAYGGAKLLAERMLLAWGQVHGVRVSCLRVAPVYGPASPGNLARLLKVCASGRLPELPRAAAGRVMVHVDDLVDACLLTAQDPRAQGRVFNVVDGELYKVDEIIERARKELGRDWPPGRVPMGFLRAAATLGDVAERASGRPAPLTTATLTKLFGPAHFAGARLRALGWTPRNTLWSALPSMLSTLEET